MSFNHLKGIVPISLVNLSELTKLRLGSNQVEYDLGKLFLDDQLLRDKPIMKNSSNVQPFLLLHLTSKLTGSIPDSIGKMTNLIELQLDTNPKFTGSLPNSFYQLINLVSVDLYNCALVGTISPAISLFSELYSLRISNNKLKGSIPVEISNLESLHILWLHGNAFTGSVPGKLCRLKMSELKADCAPLDGHAGTDVHISCKCCTTCCEPGGISCSVGSSLPFG